MRKPLDKYCTVHTVHINTAWEDGHEIPFYVIIFPSYDEAASRELDAKAMLDLRRTQPAKRKILRLTGLFPQNGSKFHFGNDDNSVFSIKGTVFFFPETIQKPSRCPQVWDDRACQGLRMN